MEVDGGGVGGNCVDIVESVEDLPKKRARACVSLSRHTSHTRLDIRNVAPHHNSVQARQPPAPARNS